MFASLGCRFMRRFVVMMVIFTHHACGGWLVLDGSSSGNNSRRLVDLRRRSHVSSGRVSNRDGRRWTAFGG